MKVSTEKLIPQLYDHLMTCSDSLLKCNLHRTLRVVAYKGGITPWNMLMVWEGGGGWHLLLNPTVKVLDNLQIPLREILLMFKSLSSTLQMRDPCSHSRRT